MLSRYQRVVRFAKINGRSNVALRSLPHSIVKILSDNGSEFIVRRVRSFLARLDVKPLFNEPGSLRENGFIDSFNGKMRDELLFREIFFSLKEAQVQIKA